MKEIKLNDLDRWVDDMMDGIDVASNDKSERNSVSLRQIMESYEESREEQ